MLLHSIVIDMDIDMDMDIDIDIYIDIDISLNKKIKCKCLIANTNANHISLHWYFELKILLVRINVWLWWSRTHPKNQRRKFVIFTHKLHLNTFITYLLLFFILVLYWHDFYKKYFYQKSKSNRVSSVLILWMSPYDAIPCTYIRWRKVLI